MADVPQFWIDVGGTFTDCFLRTPDGALQRHKLLSTGKTPGIAAADSSRRAIVDPARRRDPPGVWIGYELRLLNAAGAIIAAQTVSAFDPRDGRLTLAAELAAPVAAGQSYELAGEEAPLVAIRYLLGLGQHEAIPAVDVRLGTTRGTNSLLTRRGAKTALVATRGFADVLHIGYQNRPRLFDLNIVKPTPLFTAVAEIDERVAADGAILQPPSPDQARRELRRLRDSGVESLAVCLLHACANPAHENIVARLAAEFGFAEVSLSHEVAALGKLVSRGDTTVLDAYLNPVLRGYVAGLQQSLGQSRLRLLSSAGALTAANRFTGKDSILSGPAGGVVGYARAATAAGFTRAIGFDMGGTSTDVSRYDGRFELEFETQKAGVRVAAPMLAIETVAAGGGSICRFDGVKLVVGPESAGADPGPAAYGRGGPLTVTDLNVFLGRIPVDRFPIPLHHAAIESRLDELLAAMDEAAAAKCVHAETRRRGETLLAAMDEVSAAKAAETSAVAETSVLSQPVRYTRIKLAESLLRVANAAMVKAVRTISVAKGFNPSDYALVSFGGAGGQHACAIASELDMPHVLGHPDAGLLSAYGIGLAQLERHASASVNRVLDAGALREAARIAGQFEKTLADELAADESTDDGTRADGASPATIEFSHQLDLRYQGTEAAIGVALQAGASANGVNTHDVNAIDALRSAFEAAHRRLYGYLQPNRWLEMVAVRTHAVVRGGGGEAPRSQRVATRAAIARQTTDVWFYGARRDATVFDRADLLAGDRMLGPAIVCEIGSTLVIDPGWQGEVMSQGELLLTRAAPEPAVETIAESIADPNADTADSTADASAPDPALLEIFNNQLAGIAEQMGHTLRNTASSVNVKERLDFSCAIFTAAGALVVNAPHIPVHLGAMGETVRAIIADNPRLSPGDVFVTNDPYRGGSHLPDVTVVTPVHEAGSDRLLFFTASRAHHAEIGGLAPGSMSPFSRNLAEEGVLIRNFSLLGEAESDSSRLTPPVSLLSESTAIDPSANVAAPAHSPRPPRLRVTTPPASSPAPREPRWDDLQKLLASAPYPSRDVASNLADLAAQVAANQQGARELVALAERHSLDYVLLYMQHIQAAAEQKTRQALAKLGDGRYHRRDWLDDGTPIEVTITIAGGTARFDFTGTGPVSAGNLNANSAIVGAAVMYVLRCLLNEDIPLNQGVLAPVEIVLPVGILNPPSHADPTQCPAVVGGNVETSQRVVDVLLGALGLAAASQGTMNNLLFGDATFGYYETICGGAGATAAAPGADAVHTHMTNTRLTDPEVLERRYPVRLRSFGIRRGSGGAGQHRGGDGVVREIEFLRSVDVSLLTQRRGPAPPFGLAGGEPGALGRNTLRRADGRIEQLAALAQFTAQPGDVLMIETPGGGGWGDANDG